MSFSSRHVRSEPAASVFASPGQGESGRLSVTHRCDWSSPRAPAEAAVPFRLQPEARGPDQVKGKEALAASQRLGWHKTRRYQKLFSPSVAQLSAFSPSTFSSRVSVPSASFAFSPAAARGGPGRIGVRGAGTATAGTEMEERRR